MEVRGGRGERRGKGEGKLIFSLEFYLIFFLNLLFPPSEFQAACRRFLACGRAFDFGLIWHMQIAP